MDLRVSDDDLELIEIEEGATKHNTVSTPLPRPTDTVGTNHLETLKPHPTPVSCVRREF